MFRPFLLLLFVLFMAQLCLAQKATIVDDAGETVVVAPTTDDYGDVYSAAISTITTTTPTHKAGSGVSATKSTPTSPPASATKSIPAGKIEDYSMYQSSVTAAMNSLESASWASYTATATNLNVLTSDSTQRVRVDGSKLAFGMRICILALALGSVVL
ncbi:hypothetical protein IAR55_000831 [Kwoniella newhampshirensis]|uniref:Uncharacterized protein n=1 Tax=Kwoniella newhampshirensis TaxID=1651941 RepID=A0AAW0Z4A3_9TREE